MGYTQPQFNVRKVAGGYSIFPDGATTDDLFIYANPTDVYPLITLYGTSNLVLGVNTAGEIRMLEAGTAFFKFGESGSASTIDAAINNNDLALITQGSGVVKFGSHTGSGDVACNGSILVKDAAGNSRKLMTTA